MILVIGYGNPLRRDDGAGVCLAERLANGPLRSRVRVEREHQLMPELAQTISEPDVEAVVFTDAGIGVSDVQLARVEPSIPSPSVGHHLTPNALLTYADRLYGQRPQAWLVTLPAFDLSYGDTLTRQAETGVSDAVTQVTALIESLVAPPVGAYAV